MSAKEFADRSGGELALFVGDLPADVGSLHAAAEAFAFVRSEFVAVLELVADDGPLFFMVPNAEVGVAADGNAAFAIGEAD